METQNKTGKPVLIICTALTLLISRHLMVLLHEWAHGATAWIMGLKTHPFAIHYGDWMLWGVHENVDYGLLLAAGRKTAAALIAISAPVVNGLLFLTAVWLLNRLSRRPFIWLYMFTFWFALMNIGELYSYVPIRTFVGNRGDIGHFLYATGLSPWVIGIPGILLVGTGLCYILGKAKSNLYHILALKSLGAKRTLLGLMVLVVFFWFGSAAFYDYGPKDIRSMTSLVSVVLGLGIFIVGNRYLGVSDTRRARDLTPSNKKDQKKVGKNSKH